MPMLGQDFDALSTDLLPRCKKKKNRLNVKAKKKKESWGKCVTTYMSKIVCVVVGGSRCGSFDVSSDL